MQLIRYIHNIGQGVFYTEKFIVMVIILYMIVAVSASSLLG